jgi:tRNA pseudouridine65 synthase
MLEIIYQDEWLVAVNKPSGWLVHRSWLDRDEKVVVMQTVRDQIGQHVLLRIVSTDQPPAYC